MLTWTPDQWIVAVGGCVSAYYGSRFIYELIVAMLGGPAEREITVTVNIRHEDE